MGETIFLWPDAPNRILNIKMGRETKLKKVERLVARKLTSDKMNLIDSVLSNNIVKKEGKIEPKADGTVTLPSNFIERWEEIKKVPENFDIRMIYFKKTWRYHGVKGMHASVLFYRTARRIVKKNEYNTDDGGRIYGKSHHNKHVNSHFTSRRGRRDGCSHRLQTE